MLQENTARNVQSIADIDSTDFGAEFHAHGSAAGVTNAIYGGAGHGVGGAGAHGGGCVGAGAGGGHEDRYLKKFEEQFRAIVGEIRMYGDMIPKFKSENESLHERLVNIRGWAEAASQARYMAGTDVDAVLANFITQVLIETDKLDELKPIMPERAGKSAVAMSGAGLLEAYSAAGGVSGKFAPTVTSSDELYNALLATKHIGIDEAFKGFDFFDNNPYKKTAEKKIAKFKRKR